MSYENHLDLLLGNNPHEKKMPAHSVLSISLRLGTGILPGAATACQVGGMAPERPAALRYLVTSQGVLWPFPPGLPCWPLGNLFFVRTCDTCVSFCSRADPVSLGGPWCTLFLCPGTITAKRPSYCSGHWRPQALSSGSGQGGRPWQGSSEWA